MKTFQSLLMQTDGKKIYLLPAWPEQWDVEFKLHAPTKLLFRGLFEPVKLRIYRFFLSTAAKT